MTTTGGPDIRDLKQQTLPQAAFPGGKNQEFRIAIDPAVHAEIWKHATHDTSVEICGVLVGRLANDGQGPFLHVSASIRGEAAANKLAEVTFTHETWNRINQEMDSKYADRSIVGWYHTHPNFGIFLSDRDQFICQHFFSGPGQVALVVDPIRKQEGVFTWKNGKTQLAPYFWIGDSMMLPPREREEPSPAPRAMADSGVMMAEPIPVTHPPPPPLWQQAMLLTSVFLLGYLLHHWLAETNVSRERQLAHAEALLQFGLRPGLGQVADELQNELTLVLPLAATLSKDHVDRIEGKDEKAKMIETWNTLAERAVRAKSLAVAIEQNFALSPEEERTLSLLVDAQRRRQPPEETPKEKKGDKPKAESSTKTEAKPPTATKKPETKPATGESKKNQKSK